MNTLVEETLLQSQKEARELVHSYVPRITDTLTPLEFSRWIASNTPFILENGVSHWPAVQKWSCDYLKRKFPEKQVTVAVTPNGYADAVSKGRFIMPEERTMQMVEFIEALEYKDTCPDVFYIQKQNSNLLTDFRELLPDADDHIPWATQAFDKKPDAVNFWMGQKEAVTSLHKDFFENLYAVICGEKKFTLHPPCDRPFIPYESYQPARYRKVEGKWKIEDCEDAEPVPWIPVDPLKPDYENYPMYKNVEPITCTLKAGDLLYLPALWFHHVTQADKTIAINFWYDMTFDIKYNYYQTLDKLSQMCLKR